MRAAQIRPKPRSGEANATSIAVVKPARTNNDLTLARTALERTLAHCLHAEKMGKVGPY
jgi:hypothetical protein